MRVEGVRERRESEGEEVKNGIMEVHLVWLEKKEQLLRHTQHIGNTSNTLTIAAGR